MAPENIYAKLLGLPQPSAADRALGRLGLNAVTGLVRGLGSFLTPRYTPEQMRRLTAPGLVPHTAPSSGFYGPAYGNVSVPSGGLRDFGPGYTEEELRAGAAAEAFRPGAGFPGQQGGGGGGPAERAYRQEVSRTAQLAAQNPELTRYQVDAAAAAKSGDQARMDAVRDRGMAIWAARYNKSPKDLASRVKPGQSGYDVIQKTLYPQGAPLPPLSPAAQGMLDAVAPVNAQGIRPNITPMPGQLPAFGTASEAMYQAVTDGGRLVTPMSAPAAPTPQAAAAQNLVDIYKGEITGDDEFAKRLRAMQQYIQ